MNYGELKEAAQIKLPVASGRHSVFHRELSGAIITIAATQTAWGDEKHPRRAEARAKLVALALNHHEELVEALAELLEHFTWESSGGPEEAAYDQAQEVLTKIREAK